MRPKDLKEKLAHLSLADLYIILVYVFLRLIRHKVGSLRPIQILLPAVLLQIIFFVITITTAQNIVSTLAIGNIIIVGIILAPSAIRRPRYHWVRP